MSQLTSIQQSRKALEIITKAFKITKNIPIDIRFIVSSLKNIDTEIPLHYRYNGLVFFVVDGTVNNGTTLLGEVEKKTDGAINEGAKSGTLMGDNTLAGILYCFEKDLTKPIPLHDTILRFIIRQLTGYNGDWTNLVTDLNHTYAKAGSIVYIADLQIAVIFNGTDWVYFNGIYTIPTETAWNTVPSQFKIPNKIVHIVDSATGKVTNKIILKNLSLSDEILKSESTHPNDLENWRFYDVNGYLYFSIGGIMYQFTDKFLPIYNLSLNVGDNNITHNFNSKLLEAHCRINNTGENQDYNEYEFPISFKVVSANVINIKSSVPINRCDIILISKI